MLLEPANELLSKKSDGWVIEWSGVDTPLTVMTTKAHALPKKDLFFFDVLSD